MADNFRNDPSRNAENDRQSDSMRQPQQSQQQNDPSRGAGQAGGQQGMNDPRDRQSQQFDSASGQSGGSWNSDSSFKDQIREHMAVVGPDGQQVGTVDSIDGERIKLTRNDSPDGQHHYIECSTVEGIEGGQVRLAESPDWQSGETSRGM